MKWVVFACLVIVMALGIALAAIGLIELVFDAIKKSEASDDRSKEQK